MSALRLQDVACSFERGVPVVKDVSLQLSAGEFFCLLGPSGCGKSTLLRLIGGYLTPDRGRIWINDRDVTAMPPERRRAGMVFQNYALFPHLSALENVAFSLRVRRVPTARRMAKANEMLDWVGLTAQERRRHPSQLSGGQQQRVALARALAFEPDLLMLDEPFANLDRLLRERLREELRDVQRRVGITTILVTHDREEALSLGDRVAVMDRGQLLQVGSPEAVYRHPRDITVARFLGHKNSFRIERVEENAVEIEGSIKIRVPVAGASPGSYLLVWPERLRLHRAPCESALPARAVHLRFAGTYRVLTVLVAEAARFEVQIGAEAGDFSPGDQLWVEVPPEAVLAIPRGSDTNSGGAPAS